MKTLWAPWRMAFILGSREKGCVFCNRWKRKKDEADLILHRGKHAFVILNKYPYANGHILIVPYKHTPSLEKLDRKSYTEILSLITDSVKILKKTFRAQGFNIGSNIGKIAGAGIAEHIHFHVVPRWEGDVNYMPLIGETKVMPDHLENIYHEIRKAWRAKRRKKL
jgi:ATP adenylyltransferase